MTTFDYIAGFILITSGLFGFARGATREITTVIAFTLAAVFAVFALRATGPLARVMIHTVWLANTAAILAGFIFAYVVLRLIGGALVNSVRQTSLSGLDRVLGLGIGIVRALVVLGGFTLLLNAATPPERMPAWILHAKLYPLASAAGGALRAFAPKGLKAARGVAPDLAKAMAGDPDPETPDNAPSHTRHRSPDDTTETSP